MTKVFIITADWLKDHVRYISANVDNDLLDLSIIEAQDIELQAILGASLYNRVINDIKAGELTGKYEELTNGFILNVVTYHAIRRAINKMLFRLTNQTVGTYNRDGVEPVDFQALNFLRSSLKKDADFYTQRLINHLKDNKSDYPEWGGEVGRDLRPKTTPRHGYGMDLSS